MHPRPLATLREIAMVHGLPRLPDDRATRPDRGHVEQPGEAVPFFTDKPPEQTMVRLKRDTPVPVVAPPPLPPSIAAEPARPKPKRVHHTLDFKLMAIERVRRGESQAAVSRALDIPQPVISKWCQGDGLRKNGHEPEPILIEREREMPAKGQKLVRVSDAKRKSVIAQVLAGKKTHALIAKENGIPEGTVSSWMAHHRKATGQTSPLRRKKSSVPAKTPSSNGSPDGGSALDRLLESKLEKRLDALIEAKLVQMLEKKLGG